MGVMTRIPLEGRDLEGSSLCLLSMFYFYAFYNTAKWSKWSLFSVAIKIFRLLWSAYLLWPFRKNVKINKHRASVHLEHKIKQVSKTLGHNVELSLWVLTYLIEKKTDKWPLNISFCIGLTLFYMPIRKQRFIRWNLEVSMIVHQPKFMEWDFWSMTMSNQKL